MTLNRDALEAMGRDALIEAARGLGVRRADVLTRMELVDEIIRLSVKNPTERKRARGWLGVARDLLASVVEQGLNLPDAAAMIRGERPLETRPPEPPIATVTLAEIYAAQGHPERAIAVLDEVLAKEPEHAVARRLRRELEGSRMAQPTPEPEPTPEVIENLEKPANGESPTPEAARSDPADDALVTLRIGANQLYVYWERSNAAARSPRVRLVSTEPDPAGIRRVEQIIDAPTTVGGRGVTLTSEETIVRAALFVDDEGRSRARAVAVDARLGETGPEVVWTPRRRLSPGALLGRAEAHYRSQAS